MAKKKRTRKEQIEKDFVPRLVRALQESGSTIYKEGVRHIESVLRSAAMVGACEERDRTLAILRKQDGETAPIVDEITSKGVLDVLGYDESSESTAASVASSEPQRRDFPPRTKVRRSPIAGDR